MNSIETFEDELASVEAGSALPPTMPTAAPKKTLETSLWGAVAFELVLQRPDYIGVCATYNITLECLNELLDNEAFCERLTDAQLQVKTLGPNAGFILAARTEAEKHVFTLSNIAEDQSNNVLARVRAIENLVRFAHLDPATTKANNRDNSGASPGVLVQINMGGGLLNGKTVAVQTTLGVEKDEN